MRLEEGRRIVGTLIPGTAMEQLIKTMGQGAEEAEETIHWIRWSDPFDNKSLNSSSFPDGSFFCWMYTAVKDPGTAEV